MTLPQSTRLTKKLDTLLKRTDYNKVAIVFSLCIFLFGLALSIFRDTGVDENIYLRESMIMSELLRKGEWFGNYAVGLHGFIFKLPVALIYLVTGPSVIVATLFTLLLASLSCWLMYRILNKHLQLGGWAIAGIFLLATGFQFIQTTPTFLREIPVLLSVLLFIEAVLSRKNKWIIGLFLLLVLDAKEYVFYMLFPAYAIWIILDEYLSGETNKLTIVKTVLTRLIAGFTPSIVFLILMFFTSVIPINMYNAMLWGLTEGGFSYQLRHFGSELATLNLIEISAKSIFQFPVSENIPTILQHILSTINLLLSYIGKLLYPRTFSFLSIPKVITIPSFMMSLHLFRQWKRANKSSLLILPLVFWSYLAVFILRASMGRYLFPISSIIVIFFILFIREGIKNQELFKKTILITSFMLILGFFFEIDFILIKIVINTILMLALIVLYKLHRKQSPLLPLANLLIVVLFGITTATVSLTFSYLRGQVGNWLKWGPNRECTEVLSHFEIEENIYINDAGWGQLPFFYRKDLDFKPEWGWTLKDIVPKKHMLKRKTPGNTFYLSFEDTSNLKTQAQVNSIDKLALVTSEIPEEPFLIQEHLESLKAQDWLTLTQTVHLKNKTLYIFSISHNNH